MTTITEHHPDLLAEFPADEIGHRPGGRGMTFSYIEARQVMDRLDQTVGPDNWGDDYEPFGDPAKGAVKCTLTVCGVTKRGIGYPNSDGDQEPYKSAESDALKRAAVKVGIGRFLYPTAGGKSRAEEGNGRAPALCRQPAQVPPQGQNQTTQTPQSNGPKPATANQLATIKKLSGLLDRELPADLDTWGGREASNLISELSAEYNAVRGGVKRMQPA